MPNPREETLRRRLAACKGLPGYEKRCEAIEAELKRFDEKRAMASQEQPEEK